MVCKKKKYRKKKKIIKAYVNSIVLKDIFLFKNIYIDIRKFNILESSNIKKNLISKNTYTQIYNELIIYFKNNMNDIIDNNIDIILPLNDWAHWVYT
jgi:hypothetical protein